MSNQSPLTSWSHTKTLKGILRLQVVWLVFQASGDMYTKHHYFFRGQLVRLGIAFLFSKDRQHKSLVSFAALWKKLTVIGISISYHQLILLLILFIVSCYQIAFSLHWHLELSIKRRTFQCPLDAHLGSYGLICSIVTYWSYWLKNPTQHWQSSPSRIINAIKGLNDFVDEDTFLVGLISKMELLRIEEIMLPCPRTFWCVSTTKTFKSF